MLDDQLGCYAAPVFVDVQPIGQLYHVGGHFYLVGQAKTDGVDRKPDPVRAQAQLEGARCGLHFDRFEQVLAGAAGREGSRRALFDNPGGMSYTPTLQ